MSTSSLAFRGNKLTGKNNYLKQLLEAKLFLEVNGFMYFIDDLIKAPNKSLYFKTTHDTNSSSGAIVEDEIPRTPELDVIDSFKDKKEATELQEAINSTYGETSFELIGRYFSKLLDSDYNSFNSIDEYTSNIQASYIYLKELK